MIGGLTLYSLYRIGHRYQEDVARFLPETRIFPVFCAEEAILELRDSVWKAEEELTICEKIHKISAKFKDPHTNLL